MANYTAPSGVNSVTVTITGSGGGGSSVTIPAGTQFHGTSTGRFSGTVPNQVNVVVGTTGWVPAAIDNPNALKCLRNSHDYRPVPEGDTYVGYYC